LTAENTGAPNLLREDIFLPSRDISVLGFQ
jgi:hypothetical protein